MLLWNALFYCDIYNRCWAVTANQTTRQQPLPNNSLVYTQPHRGHGYETNRCKNLRTVWSGVFCAIRTEDK
jgi:hypothetical protein